MLNIKKNKLFVLSFLVFIVVHLFLFNINAAEWGDSYRILRAAQYIKTGSYPQDEKRPPLFSAILATNPKTIDPVSWSRGVMLIFSMGSFLLFYKLLTRYVDTAFDRLLGLLLFIFNPIYLYWSIRVMADIPFSFFVLLLAFLFDIWKDDLKKMHIFAFSIITALAILMRFEGYLLFVSIGLGIFFRDTLRFSVEFVKKSFNNIGHLAYYMILTVILLLPYLVYRNPFSSRYFAEPTHRNYDIKMVIIYIISLLFMFGLTSAFYFLIRSKRRNFEILKKNVFIFSFVFLELLLILLWPAAVPRLFTAVLPLMIILLTVSISEYFDDSILVKIRSVFGRLINKIFKRGITQLETLVILLFLIAFYVYGIFILGLQFLVISKYSFILIVLFQLLNVYAIIIKEKRIFVATLIGSLFIWSVSVIWVHKDLLKVVNEAGVYARGLGGKVAHNDVSAVTPWNLGDRGTYIDLVDKQDGSYERLIEKEIDYVLVTNEHNTDLSYDLSKRPWLTLVKRFEDDVNGHVFFTIVAKVQK